MSKRTIFFFWLWSGIVWCMGIFWAVWRYVPRVKLWWDSRWTLDFRLLKSTETCCAIDPALHDCNLSLQGSCPADTTRLVTHGIRVTIGPALITWPRDADA